MLLSNETKHSLLSLLVKKYTKMLTLVTFYLVQLNIGICLCLKFSAKSLYYFSDKKNYVYNHEKSSILKSILLFY